VTDVIARHDDGAVAVITLQRPEARNALNSELLRALPEAMAAADADDAVAAIVLTGADPAFCAGLDLKELGSSGANLGAGQRGRPWPVLAKPVIGAINGVAITGGLELALTCDFLIASERARFGDTHTRVGVLPGWGLTALLPQAIGVRRAKEMSLTGNFLDAEEALARGLVNRIVPHAELVATAVALAGDIASNDQRSVRALLSSYNRVTATTIDEGLRLESEASRAHSQGFNPAEVERRRQAIVDRGRTQTA
jgi:enoyl-CoA hydratase